MEIQYPIITISSTNHIEFVNNDDELKKCNYRALKTGYYNGLTLIDSDSTKYRVQNAKKIGTTGIFWGLNLFKGQQLKVELTIDEKTEPVELNEFRELLIKAINKDKYFWDSDGNLRQRIEFIGKASSIKEVLTKFSNDYFEKQ